MATRETQMEVIQSFIDLAEGFRCCPVCGSDDAESKHYCQHCKQSFVEEGDAYWLAQYLRKKFKEEFNEEAK